MVRIHWRQRSTSGAACSPCSFSVYCYRTRVCCLARDTARRVEPFDDCRCPRQCACQPCMDSSPWPSSTVRLGRNVHSGHFVICASEVFESDDLEFRACLVDLGTLERGNSVALAGRGWLSVLASWVRGGGRPATDGLRACAIFTLVRPVETSLVKPWSVRSKIIPGRLGLLVGHRGICRAWGGVAPGSCNLCTGCSTCGSTDFASEGGPGLPCRCVVGFCHSGSVGLQHSLLYDLRRPAISSSIDGSLARGRRCGDRTFCNPTTVPAC